MSQRPNRNRGFVLTQGGSDRLEAAITVAQQQETGGRRFTQPELEQKTNFELSSRTIRNIRSRTSRCDVTSIQILFKAFGLPVEPDDYDYPSQQNRSESNRRFANPKIDWSDAPQYSHFYGRKHELEILRKWIVSDDCQLIVLTGVGGIGKTTLAAKLTESLKSEFEAVIWRSVEEKPKAYELLSDLNKCLLEKPCLSSNSASPTIKEEIKILTDRLKEKRCLLILDNFESILNDKNKPGEYENQYKDYQDLVKKVAEAEHNSCLILTSREKPREISIFEGDNLKVRSLKVDGLRIEDCKKIFKLKGSFSGSKEEWGILVNHYSGNPLAIKMLASPIKDLLGGSISDFIKNTIKEKKFPYDDIEDILERQFERISDFEKELMYWLSLEREGVTMQHLIDISSPPLKEKIWETLKFLEWRSLVEGGKKDSLFLLQPVIKDYVLSRFNSLISTEMTTGRIRLLKTHLIVRATANDYVRASQMRLVVQPLINNLIKHFENLENAENYLKNLLDSARKTDKRNHGYLPGNIINLLLEMTPLAQRVDLSNLYIAQVFLQDKKLLNFDFENSEFYQCIFSKNFSSVLSIDFSFDDRFLASGDSSGKIHVFDTSDEKQVSVFSGHENWIWSVRFHPNNYLLFTSGEDRVVKIWQSQEFSSLGTLGSHSERVRSLSLGSSGRKLVSGSEDTLVKVWDVETKELLNLFSDNRDWVLAVAISLDEKYIASGNEGGEIKIWDLEKGKIINSFDGHSARIWSICFSPQQNIIATCSDDKTLKIWDIEGNCLRTLSGHTEAIWSIAFHPSKPLIASAGEDTVGKIWNFEDGSCINNLCGHHERVRDVRFSNKGNLIATCSDDKTIKLWDLEGRCLKTWLGHNNGVWSIDFSYDGKLLAASHDDNTISLWAAEDGRHLQSFGGHTSKVWSIDFSTSTIVSSSDDKTVKVWSVGRTSNIDEYAEVNNWPLSISSDSEGRYVAIGCDNKLVKLWDRNQALVW